MDLAKSTSEVAVGQEPGHLERPRPFGKLGRVF
jgi:hypothetical protein